MPRRAVRYGPIAAAVEALTRYMAVELGPRRISTNVVAPGAIATDFNGGVVRDNLQVNKMVADHTAFGRVGTSEDVGPVIASPASLSARRPASAAAPLCGWPSEAWSCWWGAGNSTSSSDSSSGKAPRSLLPSGRTAC
jgi:NAD(P)-dependent dehydrogenase (short-subunit alcohol dehydrogenase family)